MKISRVTVKHGRYYYIEELQPSRSGKRKQKWHPLTRVRESDAALARAVAAVLADKSISQTTDLPERVDEFMRVKRPELTFAVAREYEYIFKAVKEAFEDFNVPQVRPGDVLDFLEQFQSAPSMRKSYKARLSTFFAWCVLKGYGQVNPCRELKLKRPPKRPRRMNAQIFHAIRDKMPSIGQCFMDLTFLTCQRPTEIRLLRESQITEEGIRFRPTKTEDTSGAEVTWPLTPEIQAVLDRARKLNKLSAIGGDCYLIQTQSQSAYTTTGLHSMWLRACMKAGIDDVTTRDIRPFALSTAEKMGHKLEDLRKAAAHSSVETTEGYLAQYREVISPVRMSLPPKPKR